MKRGLAVLILIFILVSISGCDVYTEKKQEWFGLNQQPNMAPVNLTEQCPKCDSSENADAIIYYFNSDINKGLKDFIKESDNYLYCSFPRLDISDFNGQFKSKANTLDELKIKFDKQSTMDCSTACIPYSYSQYNDLFGAGLDISVQDNIHDNYCVSEDGLFITSKLLDQTDRSDYALFLKSKGLRDLFKEKFRGGN